MSSFTTVSLVTWIFLICIETSTSNIVRRRLTKHQVELDLQNKEYFPDILPVILKAPGQVLKFNFAKRKINYDVPVYVSSKPAKKVIVMETPPIKDAAFYEDRHYDASVTLHCKDHSVSSHLQKNCSIRLMSGFFHLDGHKHVIEPEKRDSKRVTLLASQNPNNQFFQKHRVYKLSGHNHNCNVKQHNRPPKKIVNGTLNTGNKRSKRFKDKYIIEVLALITLKLPVSEEEVKEMKIYYTHVFWGVNMLFNHIYLNDVSFGVNLIGIFLLPEDTELYKFAKGSKGDYLNGTLSLNSLANANYKDIPQADHVVMFSVHNISDNPSIVGLANVGAMCNDESVSLCRVLKSFEEIHVVAHELGHSMNSYHDGQRNFCFESDGYIMAATTISFPTKRQILNGYEFSPCSIRDMKSFAGSLYPNCLLYTVKDPVVPSVPTGQLYPPKEQCKTSSRSSGICSSVYSQNNSAICLSVNCRKDGYLCKSIVPAFKTTCGNKKWCMYGQCVYDKNAPPADENCLFGDDENLKFTIKYQNGEMYQPKDCPDIISRVPSFCAVPNQRVYCCHSCNILGSSDSRTSPSWSWFTRGSSSSPTLSSSSSPSPSSFLLSLTPLLSLWLGPSTTQSTIFTAVTNLIIQLFLIVLAVLSQLKCYST